MKAPLHPWFLGMVIITLLHSNKMPAQSIQAGMHAGNEYFVDLVPDSANMAIHNGPGAFYSLDLNGDGTADFKLLGANSGGLGGNSSSTYIQCLDSNEVAFGEYDSCFGMSGFVYATRIAKAFAQGEMIDGNAQWTKSQTTLAASSFVMNTYSCNLGLGAANPIFLGLKLFTANDTIYGWIKLSSLASGSFTLAEYGCTANTSSFKDLTASNRLNVSPNPCTNYLNLDLVSMQSIAMIEVSDAAGRIVFSENSTNYPSMQLDVSHWSNGYYHLQLTTSNHQRLNTKFIIVH